MSARVQACDEGRRRFGERLVVGRTVTFSRRGRIVAFLLWNEYIRR